MDANGTRFHLLLGRDDWANCLDAEARPLNDSWPVAVAAEPINESGVDWDALRGELTLRQRLFQFTAISSEAPPSPEDRRGAACDSNGNWYWIDESRRQVLVNSVGTRRTSHFWSSIDQTPCATPVGVDFQPSEPERINPAWELRGLAVTEDHYLVVGILQPAGLLIFDLHAGGGPRQLLWPATVRFSPFDMAAAPGGGVFVLDRDNSRYWILDRHFNIKPASPDELAAQGESSSQVFQSAQPDSARDACKVGEAETITDAAACRLPQIYATAIEALPDGTVLILDGDPSSQTRRFSLIRRYRLGLEIGKSASTEAMASRIESEPESFTLLGYDFAFKRDAGVSSDEPIAGHLYVVERNGNQCYAFSLQLIDDEIVLRALADYLPMRLFGKRALVASDAGVFYDSEDQWVPLVAQKRPRYLPEATIFTPLTRGEGSDRRGGGRNAFDGHEIDCVWHRLMLDACIPPDAEVRVWSRAANDQNELALAEWRAEPRPYLRGNGSELPFAPRPAKEIKGLGTWELLFQNARGRFLQLQLALAGNERSTPRLRALRVYYPRFSYLINYLPAVYREDPESASFLDRFLANVEGIYTSIEDRIAAAQLLFDSRSVPAEALDWLARWFGVVFDSGWDDARKRIFIKHAIEFFTRRGTIRGLEIALHLALDPCVSDSLFADTARGENGHGIRVVEKFRTRRAPGAIFGDPTDYDSVPRGVSATRWLTADNPTASSAPRSSAKSQSLAGSLIRQRRTTQTDTAGANLSTSDDGAAAIASERQGWQTFLGNRYASIQEFNTSYTALGELPRTEFAAIPLPLNLPRAGAPLDDWLAWLLFSSRLGRARERKLWQDFLARHYRMISALNRTHGTQWTSFQMISLPNDEPVSNLLHQDWHLFSRVVLAMHRTAHRFTVLLPVPLASRRKASLAERRAKAAQVINLQKPAHTTFEVKFYWTAFRLGEARLGTDTIVERGSRMMAPMILDQSYIAEGYLASRTPPDLVERHIIGRTRLGR